MGTTMSAIVLGDRQRMERDRRREPSILASRRRRSSRLIGLVAIAVLVLLVRAAIARTPGRHHIVVPAMLEAWPESRLAWIRHVPLVLFVAGLPLARAGALPIRIRRSSPKT